LRIGIHIGIEQLPDHALVLGLVSRGMRFEEFDACFASPGLICTLGATIMVPLWLERSMATTLTLKNIPDEVYQRLKASAVTNRRSLNSEAIVCLEAVLLPGRVAPGERIARARELRSALPKGKFRARDIDALKREGRQ
jgi:plasmid stability protein